MCRPLPNRIDPGYSAGHIFEYSPSGDALFRYYAELTTHQDVYVKCVYGDYNLLSPSQHDYMLDFLLKESGRSKITVLMITGNISGSQSILISMLGPNEKPLDKNCVEGMPGMWKTSLANTRNGVLSVSKGTVVQIIYNWPFQKEKLHLPS